MAPINIDSIIASATPPDASSNAASPSPASASDAQSSGPDFSSQLQQAVQQQPAPPAPTPVTSPAAGGAKSRHDKTTDATHTDSKREDDRKSDSTSDSTSGQPAHTAHHQDKSSDNSATPIDPSLVLAAHDSQPPDAKQTNDASSSATSSAASDGKDTTALLASGVLAAATAAAGSTAASTKGATDGDKKDASAGTPTASVPKPATGVNLPAAVVVAGAAIQARLHHGQSTSTTKTISSTGSSGGQHAAVNSTSAATNVDPTTAATNGPTAADAKPQSPASQNQQVNPSNDLVQALNPTQAALAAAATVTPVVNIAAAATDASKQDGTSDRAKPGDAKTTNTDSLNNIQNPLNTPAPQQTNPLQTGVSDSNQLSTSGSTSSARFVQRVAGAFRAAEQNGGPVLLRLSPPELGSVTVEIRVDQGQVHAHIEAETPQAQSLLLDNLPALRDRLEQQDIKVASFDVGLMGNNNNGGGNTPTPDRSWQQSGDGAPQSTFTQSTAATIDAVAPATATVAATTNFSQGVNVLV